MVERRLDRLETNVDEIHKMLSEFGHKLFNGYGAQITNIENIVQPLARKVGELDDVQIECKATQRAKEEMMKRYEARFKIYLAVLALISASPWAVKLFGG